MVGDSGLTDQVGEPAAPRTPHRWEWHFLCALGYVCITPRENSWGRGSGLLADQLNWPSRERIAPALRFGFAVDRGGSLFESFFCHLRLISKEGYRGQVAATSEGFGLDVGNVIGDRDAS